MILMVLLAACAGIGDTQTAIPMLTLSPPSTAVTGGTCETTRTLEAWLQAAQFRLEEVERITDEAVERSRDELYADVERLAELRTTLAQQPAPDCTVNAQTLLLDAMDALIEDLQAYVNRDRDDLDSLLVTGRRRFSAAQTAFGALVERLEDQFQTQAG